jgi:methylmalonyl-CoA/ethylmalonyl-CoA epimerase
VGSTFHHVGLACRDLERDQRELGALGYRPAGDRFSDPRQGVVGVFLEGPGPCLELLMEVGDSDVLRPWLQGGARMYHLGYVVADLEKAIAGALAAGARQVSPPQPAVAFGRRQICFVMLRNLFLVELIESEAGQNDNRAGT